MSPRRKRPLEDSKSHTVIIGDVHAMWEKLWWDVEVFSDIQRGYPDEVQPLVYSALNACIAAWSLEKWAQKALTQSNRLSQGDVSGAFDKCLAEMVPAQAMCNAIANTAKHASFFEATWSGGELRLEWHAGDESCPPGYVLIQSASGERGSMLNSLFSLPADWWNFLVSINLVSGPMPTPVWFQNKMQRIFGGPYDFEK